MIMFKERYFHLSYEVLFQEKLNKLKKSNEITFSFILPLSEKFDDIDISNINIEVWKGTKMNPLYKWIFYNCNLVQVHISPSKWSNDKIVYLKVVYEDVFGSHVDGIINTQITSKIRDKKLDDLLK
jgi:hypothetical protein